MPLTWRNVAAPDFSPALAGYQASANMLDRALAAARGGFERVDSRISDQVNNAFQTQLLGYQDAGALEAALAENPTLGFDARRVNADSRALAGSQVNTLLGRQQTRQDIRQGDLQYDRDSFAYGEEKGKVERLEAGSPFITAMTQAAISGDTGAFQTAFQGAKDSGLRADEILSAVANAQDLLSGQTDIAGAQQDQAQSSTRFRWEGEDRLNQTKAAELANLALSQGDNPESWLYALERNSKGVDPRVVAQARSMITGEVGNIYAVGGGSSGEVPSGGSFAGNPMGIVNYEARGRGFASVPDSVQTLGDLDSWGTTVLRGSNGSYSSASGPYQITRNTFREFAPEALGSDWKSAPNTFETHDAVAKAIFERSNGSNSAIRGRWAALNNMSDAEVAALRRMPWEQARQTIARLESNTNPARALSNATVEVSTAAAVSNIGNGNNSGRFAAKFGNDAYPVEAARELSEAMPGVPVNFLTQQINSIMQRSVKDGEQTINAGQAADILLKNYNVQSQPGWVQSLMNLQDPFNTGLMPRTGTPNIGNEGLRLNEKGIAQDIESARNGEFVDREIQKRSTLESGQSIIQIGQQVAALSGRLAQVERQIAGGRTGLIPERDRIREELLAATIAQQQITQQNGPSIGAGPPPGSVGTPWFSGQTTRRGTGESSGPSFSSLFRLRRD